MNWFNCGGKLKALSEDLLNKFGVKNTKDIEEIQIKRQFNKIDVFLALKGINTVIIIEDKTYTSEHGEQIKRYNNIIAEYKNENKNNFGIDKNTKVISVYFKTGFFYDYDKAVCRKLLNDSSLEGAVLNGEEFRDILHKYIGESEILDSYYYQLCKNIEWYGIYGKYDKIPDDKEFSLWDCNISKYRIAQYKFMRDIFTEDMWRDKNSNLFKVSHGSNKDGRPWTIMIIKQFDDYYFQWNIDCNQHGPFIALRMYNKYDKENNEKKEKHINEYRNHKNIIKSIIDKNEYFKWEDIEYKKNTENRYDAAFIIIYLKDKLKNWEKEKDEFINNIRRITDEFIN